MAPHEPHTMKCEATVTYSGLCQQTYLTTRHKNLKEMGGCYVTTNNNCY